MAPRGWVRGGVTTRCSPVAVTRRVLGSETCIRRSPSDPMPEVGDGSGRLKSIDVGSMSSRPGYPVSRCAELGSRRGLFGDESSAGARGVERAAPTSTSVRAANSLMERAVTYIDQPIIGPRPVRFGGSSRGSAT